MRALFDYEPEDDTLLPCKEIGLPFQYGDILQVCLSPIFVVPNKQFFETFEKINKNCLNGI